MEQSAFAGSITRAFGRGFSRQAIISSASLAVLCLFYVYTAASFFEIRVYPLIDRFTHIGSFVVYLTNEYVDHVIIGSLLILWLALASKKSKIQYAIIGGFGALFAATAATNYGPALEGFALASLPVILFLPIFNRYYDRKFLSQLSSEITLNHLATVGIIISIMGLGLVLVPVLFPEPLPQPPMRGYAYDVYLVLSSSSPVLILLLITCIPVKILSDSIVRTLKMQHFIFDLQKHVIRRKFRILYLALIMLLSVLLAVIPHLPTVNPDGQQVGVDTGFYVTWLTALEESGDSGEFFYNAFVSQADGSRPLSLLFLYALNEITSAGFFITVEYVPLILAPALALVTFFLTRELTSNDVMSLFAAFITAVSFQTLIGIYAGFYANWLALVIGYLSFLFLVRFLKAYRIRNLILFGMLTLLVLFTHVYTWSVLAIAVGIFLTVGIVWPWALQSRRRNASLLLVALLSVVAFDIARTVLIGSSSGVESDLELAESFVGPERFLLRWNNLSYTTTTYVGGLFANFLVFSLGLYWLVKTRVRNIVAIFMFSFLSLGILPFIIGEFVVQTRIFYNIPFQIPAAIALALIAQEKKGLLRILPICILFVLAAVVAVSNYYFVVPEQLRVTPLG